MKRIIISLLFFICFNTVNADEVVLKTGERIRGKIIENTDRYIKIRDSSNNDIVLFVSKDTVKLANAESAIESKDNNIDEMVYNSLKNLNKTTSPSVEHFRKDTLYKAIKKEAEPIIKKFMESPTIPDAPGSSIEDQEEKAKKEMQKDPNNPWKHIGYGRALEDLSFQLSAVPNNRSRMIRAFENAREEYVRAIELSRKDEEREFGCGCYASLVVDYGYLYFDKAEYVRLLKDVLKYCPSQNHASKVLRGLEDR